MSSSTTDRGGDDFRIAVDVVCDMSRRQNAACSGIHISRQREIFINAPDLGPRLLSFNPDHPCRQYVNKPETLVPEIALHFHNHHQGLLHPSGAQTQNAPPLRRVRRPPQRWGCAVPARGAGGDKLIYWNFINNLQFRTATARKIRIIPGIDSEAVRNIQSPHREIHRMDCLHHAIQGNSPLCRICGIAPIGPGFIPRRTKAAVRCRT